MINDYDIKYIFMVFDKSIISGDLGCWTSQRFKGTSTWNAFWHIHPSNIQVHPNGHTIKKGFNPDVDSYSAFFDNKKLGKTNMEELIRKEEVTDLYVCGIATDVCVGNTPSIS